MSVPYYIATNPIDLEDEQWKGKMPCYVVAQRDNKIELFLLLDSGICRSLTLCENESLLCDIPSDTVNFKIPRIPAPLIWTMIDFFREVDRIHSAEAVTLLEYSDNKYVIHVPKQEVSTMSIHDYDRQLINDGKIVGSIHSHQNASAFQSGTDHADEISFPGVHLTFGKVNDIAPDVHARVVIAKKSLDIDPKAIMSYETNNADLTKYPEFVDIGSRRSMVADWLTKVSKKTYTTYYGSSGYVGYGCGYNYNGPVDEYDFGEFENVYHNRMSNSSRDIDIYDAVVSVDLKDVSVIHSDPTDFDWYPEKKGNNAGKR